MDRPTARHARPTAPHEPATHPAARRPDRGAHVDSSLRLRVRIYLVIFVVASGLVVGDALAIGGRSLVPVVVGAGLGGVLGVVASRISRLGWDTASGKVVGRLDGIGAAVLVGYVLFILLREDLLSSWFAAPVVGVASLATLAGLMAGQVLGAVRGIEQVATLAGRRGTAGSAP